MVEIFPPCDVEGERESLCMLVCEAGDVLIQMVGQDTQYGPLTHL